MRRHWQLPPDRFLYDRKGPWPQPSPAHPLLEAPEVLNVPAEEWTLWNATIGERYLKTQLGQPPVAAAYAIKNLKYQGPSDEDFNKIMFETAYSRFQRHLNNDDRKNFSEVVELDKSCEWIKYDFRAMEVVEPLDGLYCAATELLISINKDTGVRKVEAISLRGTTSDVTIYVIPSDPAWTMAKAFALQGAAYHMLFVVHPTLHFPMDSVNAVTKTSIPMTHPIFQMLYPHTQYSLALNNAVLEGEDSVVNNNAAGTWFDPLTGDGYNLKLLFGAGYAGYPKYGESYPKFDYMNPQMGTFKGDLTSPYLQALEAYYKPFEAFATVVAKRILENEAAAHYAFMWGRYLHPVLKGFPEGYELVKDADVLGRAMAIYMWDVSVGHAADHYSFGTQVAVRDKMLRIRIPVPTDRNTPPPNADEGEFIATADDLFRASVCQQMFFLPFSIQPDLAHLGYPLLDPACMEAFGVFHESLFQVDKDLQSHCPHGQAGVCCFQPLVPRDSYPKPIGDPTYEQGPFDPKLEELTIPSTIQY